MKLTNSQILEYQFLHKTEFDEEISFAEAERQAHDFIALLTFLLEK